MVQLPHAYEFLDSFMFACRYGLHPGVFDACIHLAPVPAAGAAITVTRVPVTAGALLLPATDGAHGWGIHAVCVRLMPAAAKCAGRVRWIALQQHPLYCC